MRRIFIFHCGLCETNCDFPYCCAGQILLLDHTVCAMRPERDGLGPCEWKPDEKMKSFQHHLISAFLHIRGPFTVKRILRPFERFPGSQCTQTPCWSQAMQAVGGSGSGEKGLIMH